MANYVEHLFMHLFATHILFFEMSLNRHLEQLLPFKKLGSLTVMTLVLYIVWIQVSCQVCDLQIFSPTLWLIFHSLMTF